MATKSRHLESGLFTIVLLDPQMLVDRQCQRLSLEAREPRADVRKEITHPPFIPIRLGFASTGVCGLENGVTKDARRWLVGVYERSRVHGPECVDALPRRSSLPC